MTAQQRRLKVFLLGDSCVDQYVHIQEQKHNPECAAPLLMAGEVFRKMGMAENVALCLERLNIIVTPCMPTDLVDLSVKTRYVDSGGNTIFRVDVDRQSESKPNLVKSVNLNNFDAVVISDYNKGFVSTETIKYVTDNFRGPIFLDTKKHNLQDFSDCIIKINEKEYGDAQETTAQLYVTLGERGLWYLNKTYPTLKVQCADPCGAGDAFLAGLVYGYFQCTTYKSFEYALVNAAISTTRRGTYAPTLQELEKGLLQYDTQLRQS